MFKKKEKGGLNLQTMVAQSELDTDLVKTILSHLAADNVNVATNGVRSAGYLVLEHVNNNTSPPAQLITPFVRSMNPSSNDVKVTRAWSSFCVV